METDAQLQTTEETEEKPRRYEVVNAETGDPVQGVSFILTPTGEEMHMLTEPGHYVGPLSDIGVYYHGHTTNEPVGNNSLPALKPMALQLMAERIVRELAELGSERRRYDNVRRLKEIASYATRLYDRYREENAELVAEQERKEEESRAYYRKKYGGQAEED